MAIQAWLKVLGEEAVLINKSEILPYTGNTTGAIRSIKGVLLPTCAEDVQEIVRIARMFKMPLYPVSGGKNWGYGSANPAGDAAFIVDLSRMNRIKDFDSELGVVTVEPGVTQQDLYEFLQAQGDEFMVPTTGAGPGASILGNALERGYGLTPHSDHFEAITSFHAVLPDGEYYKPALSEMGGHTIERLFKWGVGPYLDGIFTQGNFGIVTQGSLLLARRPERVSSFIFAVKNDASLEKAVAAIRNVKREIGSNIGAINLMNARRVLAMMEPCPEDLRATGQMVPKTRIQEKMRKHRITAWSGFGAIYGNKTVVKAVQEVIKKCLKPHVKQLVFVSERSLNLARAVKYILPSFYRKSVAPKVNMLDAALKNVSGIPSQVALPLSYWKSETQPNTGELMDPARDQCGLLWHAPLVPLTPQDIRKHVDLVTNICSAHNIDPLITLTVFSEQCCDSTVPILFNKAHPADTKNAKTCHQALLEQEAAHGYVPYRLGIDTMRNVINPSHSCWRFARKLKEAIDPDQLIAPGRYVPGSEHPECVARASSGIHNALRSDPREIRSNRKQASRNTVGIKSA